METEIQIQQKQGSQQKKLVEASKKLEV